MQNILRYFHHNYSIARGNSLALVNKHKHHAVKHAHHFMLVALAVVVSIFLYNKFAYAATFNFSQTSWIGGVDTVSVATHTSNQSNWTKYATSTGLTVGSTLQLATTPYTFTDDGTTTPQNIASGGGFSNGTNTQTITSVSQVALSINDNNIGTGGTITYSSGYAIQTFTSSGNFTPPSADITSLEYLVVAAGGRGGNSSSYGPSGGGGGGGMRTGVMANLSAGTYPITVGTPGAFNGGDSIFSSITSSGGGYGGSVISSGGNGGSGGGDGFDAGGIGGLGNTPATTPSQGNNGSDTGGGGGAGAAANTGTGGVGREWPVGSGVFYARGGNYNGSGISGATSTGNGGAGNAGAGGLGGAGGSGIVIVRYLLSYNTSGTFTSAVIDMGTVVPSFGTISWTATLNGQTITMKARSSATSDFSGATAWSSCTNITSGNALSTGGCVTNGHQYIQYQATLSTTDTAVTPTLDNVTIGYSQYGSGNLTSSVYDSLDATNLVTSMRWTASGTSSTETIKFQVRSAASTSTLETAPWCGPGITCDGTTYFTDSAGGTALATNHPLRSGGNDEFFQYKVIFASAGGITPVLSSATVQYVVNAPPQFDATYGTNGVSAYQVSTSSDPNFSKVIISYKIRDPDTTTGTANPGFVTPSFEYNTGSGWVAITDSYLATGDVTNKVVDNVNYNTYTAVWSATTSISNLFASTTQIRVTVNDNEAANNTAQAISASFILDTKAPTSAATLNSPSGAIILTITDDSLSQYRICNDSTFPTADNQSNSCAWSALASNLASSTVAWIPYKDANGNTTIYIQTKDALGNTATQTIVGPAMPTNFDYKDISNSSIEAYREFLSWGVFQATTSSTFASYKLYHSTDGVNYTVLTTITDSAINYFKHDISTATTSTHFYKVVAVDSNGDISDYTTVLSDVPNGQGSSDTTPPVIDPASIIVPAGNLKNNSANITFTTDEISNGDVQYKISGDSGWHTLASISYVIAHSIYIQGLTPNTTYNLQVRSTDISGNVSQYVTGPNFTTVGGPVITGVTPINLTDNSVTVFWNTSTSSDSYVYYSPNQNIIPSTTAWSAMSVPCVTDICQHKIDITGLTPGTKYYYYVKSTDSSSNTSIDDNNGSYYSFYTTLDVNPPVISGIATPVISSVAAVLVWQTDEPATSQVQWGIASGALSHTTLLDSTKSAYHVVSLSSATNDTNSQAQTLLPSTPYFYKVFSNDSAGNSASSTEQTFSTTADGQVTIVTQYISSGGGGTSASTAVTPDTISPVIFSATTTNIGAFNADVVLTTNEDVSAFIDYGETTDYGDTKGDGDWNTSKVVRLKKLQTGTLYHYRIKARDRAGNDTVSSDATFTTLFISELSSDRSFLDKASDIQGKTEALIESALPSLSPPFVSKPEIVNITENSANITWKTNIKTIGSLHYATDADYTATSTYSLEVPAGANKETNHMVDLANLQPNTTYHIQATSYVFPQVVGKAPDVTFTTKAAKIQASIVEKKNDSFTIAWSTEEPTTSIVEYKNTKTGETNRITDDNKKTYHSVKIDHLPSAITFMVKVSGINAIGNTVDATESISVTTSSDVIPPKISNFKVDNALVPGRNDRIQTVVGWQTDELANSTVYYEEGVGTPDSSKELANKVEALDNYVANHIMILASLKPGTVYRIKIVTSDPSGNTKSFGPNTIITPRQTESVLDVIFKNFEDTFKFLRKGS